MTTRSRAWLQKMIDDRSEPLSALLERDFLDSVPVMDASGTGVYYGIALSDFRKDAAWKDQVDDAPGVGLLGLTDTTGAPLLGNAANANQKTDKAQVTVALPWWYKAGDTITVRIRAKIATSLALVKSVVDAVVKVIGDAGAGSDICTTTEQQVTTAYADYDFVVTPTGRVAGDVLNIQVTLDNNDTGGTNNKAMSIVAFGLVFGK